MADDGCISDEKDERFEYVSYHYGWIAFEPGTSESDYGGTKVEAARNLIARLERKKANQSTQRRYEFEDHEAGYLVKEYPGHLWRFGYTKESALRSVKRARETLDNFTRNSKDDAESEVDIDRIMKEARLDFALRNKGRSTRLYLGKRRKRRQLLAVMRKDRRFHEALKACRTMGAARMLIFKIVQTLEFQKIHELTNLSDLENIRIGREVLPLLEEAVKAMKSSHMFLFKNYIRFLLGFISEFSNEIALFERVNNSDWVKSGKISNKGRASGNHKGAVRAAAAKALYSALPEQTPERYALIAKLMQAVSFDITSIQVRAIVR